MGKGCMQDAVALDMDSKETPKSNGYILFSYYALQADK